jgi:hypothetical protein
MMEKLVLEQAITIMSRSCSLTTQSNSFKLTRIVNPSPVVPDGRYIILRRWAWHGGAIQAEKTQFIRSAMLFA